MDTDLLLTFRLNCIYICQELNLINQNDEKEDLLLPKLREKISSHIAFADENNINLIRLAEKHGVNILWCPKYHCELNPIEGLWCHSKYFVRRNNDQEFNKLNNLICASFENFQAENVNIKLWGRFWHALEMYNNNASYEEVLNTHFGAKQSSKVVSHKKNKDFNNNL